jgi:hypothetical protein
MLVYLSRERRFLKIKLRQNAINSANFSSSSRNTTNNIFIRRMILVPILLGNIKIRGKGLKTVSKYLAINTINSTNIMKVIGSNKSFNAFIMIIYT